MKAFIKKITVTVCAVSASAMLLTAAVTATETARPLPDSSAVTETSGVNTSEPVGAQAEGAAAVTAGTANTVTTQTNTSAANKKYLSRTGGFLWFLLSVIVNFIISCWVGNRFYRLARRSAQGSSEIRALRKDIEEKFASTLNDIAEPATEVINRNESYARSDEGLAMPERRNHVEMNEEEREMMRKWDYRRAYSKAAEAEEDEQDYEDEQEAEPRPAKRSYQPTRRSSGIDFEDDGYDEDDEYEDGGYEARRPARPAERREAQEKKSTISNAKSRAKDFLSNVFPFDE